MITESFLVSLFYITLGLIFGNVILLYFKLYKPFKIVRIITIIALFISFIGSYFASGHLPVYNKFATLPNMNMILLFLGLFYNRTPQIKGRNINVIWIVALVLQLLVLFFEMELNSNYFMYDKLYVIGFFQFRIIAVALFVFAIANYVTALVKISDKEYEKDILQTGRNFTLLGAIFYLLGECVGSWWSFVWLGDSWHWSKGFLYASVMFLLSMVGSHLPIKYLGTKNRKVYLYLIPLVIIVIIYFFAH